MNKLHPLAAAIALAALPLTAEATNGYFTHGNSIKAQGMAGVSYAMAHDSISVASNPAALTALGDQLDLGVTWFKPERDARISGNPAFNGQYDGNGDKSFWIPELGFSRQHSERLAYGVAMYANGGMNTSYANNPYAGAGATGDAGVDLSQLFVTSSVGYRLTKRHSVGVGLTYVYQMFEARGVNGPAFESMSSNPAALSDNGHDSSDGFGLKLGWQGQVTDTLTLAASWSSKIKTDSFSDYRGLFAEQGGFDVPETYGLGFAWQMNPQWTLAGDWQRINYSDVASVGNPLIPITQLGQDNGSGFGWQDINVYKLGVSYDWSSRLTFRAGYSYADQPVPSSETFFNILAPGVVQEHVSLGASWRPSPAQELTFAYTRALEESVEGNGSLAAFGGGEADLSMSQDILGLAWSYRF